jgi:hypothetical protein
LGPHLHTIESERIEAVGDTESVAFPESAALEMERGHDDGGHLGFLLGFLLALKESVRAL